MAICRPSERRTISARPFSRSTQVHSEVVTERNEAAPGTRTSATGVWTTSDSPSGC